MNIIEHIVKFKKLYLTWQADNDPQHMRYIVAELKSDNAEAVELKYLSSSPDYQTAIKLGFSGYPAFPIDNNIYNNEVLEAFKRRLPPRSRNDFNKYLEILRLPPVVEITDFSLLGYSGAKLPGDSFSITPCFDGQAGPFEFLIEIAGLRHVAFDREAIKIGDPISFGKDANNTFDKNAIKIVSRGTHIGFVPRSLTNIFNTWMANNSIESAVIERKNGQADHPVWYVFVKIK